MSHKHSFLWGHSVSSDIGGHSERDREFLMTIPLSSKMPIDYCYEFSANS